MNDSRSSLVTFDDDDRGDDVLYQEVALLDANNMAAVIEKIDELKNLLNSLIMKLKDHDLNTDKLIKFLKTKKEAVDKNYRKQNAAVTVFSGISATGGVTMLIGSAGAAVTAGASLALVIAGGITVGIGTFGSVIAKRLAKRRRWSIMKECKEELRKIELDSKEIGMSYEKLLSKFREVCRIFGLSAKSSLGYMSVETSKPIGKQSILNTAGIPFKTAEVGVRFVRLSNLLAKVSDSLHLEVVGEAMIPALKTFFKFGTAITGLGIGIDLVVGGIALHKLVKGTQCAESKSLALVIDEAESHAQLIKSYLQLLEHHPKDLFLEATTATRQIGYQTEQLQNASVMQPEIEQLS